MTLPSHVHSKFIREPIATLRVFLGARQRRIPWVWHVIAPSFRPGPFGSGAIRLRGIPRGPFGSGDGRPGPIRLRPSGSGPPGGGEPAAPGGGAGPPAGILRRTRAH